jgi:hypothetical protein
LGNKLSRFDGSVDFGKPSSKFSLVCFLTSP